MLLELKRESQRGPEGAGVLGRDGVGGGPRARLLLPSPPGCVRCGQWSHLVSWPLGGDSADLWAGGRGTEFRNGARTHTHTHTHTHTQIYKTHTPHTQIYKTHTHTHIFIHMRSGGRGTEFRNTHTHTHTHTHIYIYKTHTDFLHI